MNNVEAREEFAKVLVQAVRDATIQDCDRALEADAQSPIARRWREAGASEHPELARMMIADCVDLAIAGFLAAVDQDVLQIAFRRMDGALVDLSEVGRGELCGWYMGTDGWRSSYSRERYVDDCADL